MEHDMIKSAAACLADTALSAREKQAQGIWESAKQDPLKYSLMGAGLGATAGGVGGGLLSWLRRRPDEDKGKRRRDILAGALIGGGLGAGAGATPGLVGAIQKGTKPPEYEVERPKGIPEAAWEDIKGLISPGSVAGAGLGGLAAGGGIMKYLRHLSLADIPKLDDNSAVSYWRQVSGRTVDPTAARKKLERLVKNTSLRRSMVRSGRDLANLISRGRVSTRTASGLGRHGAGIGRYGLGMYGTLKSLGGKVPLRGKAGLATAGAGALLTALLGKKVLG